jgi:hypothetical protein
LGSKRGIVSAPAAKTSAFDTVCGSAYAERRAHGVPMVAVQNRHGACAGQDSRHGRRYGGLARTVCGASAEALHHGARDVRARALVRAQLRRRHPLEGVYDRGRNAQML